MNSTRFSALAELVFSSKSSWTLKTKLDDSRDSVWLSFGAELGLRQTQTLISTTNYFTIDGDIGTNQSLCLPKAELNTNNSSNRQLCCLLVEFLVFSSIH